MQPFNTLLVALTVAASTAVIAADQPVPAADAPRLAASADAHSWPTERTIEHAWPEWMSKLQGPVLVLHNSHSGYSRTDFCTPPRCGVLPAQAQHNATVQPVAQHPSGAASIGHANLPWRSDSQTSLPQRFSF